MTILCCNEQQTPDIGDASAWDVSGVTAGTVVPANGVMTLTAAEGLVDIAAAFKVRAPVPDHLYAFDCVVSGMTAGNVKFGMGGAVMADVSANGTYTGFFTPTANTPYPRINMLLGGTTCVIERFNLVKIGLGKGLGHI